MNKELYFSGSKSNHFRRNAVDEPGFYCYIWQVFRHTGNDKEYSHI
jgi:hypothetical protein